MDRHRNFIKQYLDFDSQYQWLMIERLKAVAKRLAKTELITPYLPAASGRLDKAQTFKCITLATSALVKSGSVEAGILLGKTFTIEDFGLFNIAIKNSKSLDEALSLICRYCSQVEFGLSLDYQVGDEQSYLQIHAHINDVRRPWYVEDALFGCINILKGLAQQQLTLKQVALTTHRPSRSHYFSALACPVQFNCPHTRIYFEPFQHQAVLNNQNLNEVAARWMLTSQDRQDKLITTIYELMFAHIGQGRLTLNWMAQRLHTSSATLKRKLSRLNTRFSTIQNEIRMLLAYDYLLSTDLSLIEIGQILDYSDSGNFCRAFKGWFGCSPLQFRKVHHPINRALSQPNNRN